MFFFLKRVRNRNICRGVSFVEVLVVAAIILLFFSGLFAGLRSTIIIISTSKGEAGALALLNERLEYIRSLPYDDVGTVGGIPDGNLAQNSTTTLNNIVYSGRTLVQYVDAPEDGTGVSDENGITADYKRVKIEYSWNTRGGERSRSLISDIVPRSIETIAGGGTLTVNVFDALAQPVSGADVRVVNNTTTTTIDVVVSTNVNGIATFPGAPAAAGYELSATKSGFSTDQTYSASSTNQNPSPSHVAVVESEVSTINFAIDATSDLTVQTVGVPTTDTFSDTFTTSVNLVNPSSTTVSGEEVILTDTAGAYNSPGTVFSTSTAPVTFDSWVSADFTATTPTSTALTVQVYSVSGTNYTLVSDIDLPGNSSGFTSGPIDLSALAVGIYPELALGATLTTSDTTQTPRLSDWEIEYITNEPAIGNISFTLTSDKTIGTDISESPIPKYNESHTTDSGGDTTINDLEWDLYDVTLNTGAYDIAEACNNIPYTLSPGVTETLKLTLTSAVTYSLRVAVLDITGDPIGGATVRLQNTGVDETQETSVCGQTFFNTGLYASGDYTVDVSAPGYTDESIDSVTIDDASMLTVTLN